MKNTKMTHEKPTKAVYEKTTKFENFKQISTEISHLSSENCL